MEKHVITSRWLGNKAFEGEIAGHKIKVDTPSDSGGDDSGPSPKKLLLLSLAGCTGIDVVSILSKMKVEVKDLRITVEGEVMDEHPKYYRSMHVVYEFTGEELPADKVQRAVTLSEEKYCGVRALFTKAIPVTSEIKIVKG